VLNLHRVERFVCLVGVKLEAILPFGYTKK